VREADKESGGGAQSRNRHRGEGNDSGRGLD